MSGIPDRRRHLRQRVRSLTYIDLGQNNGGIILNISEGGFALQAATILTSDHFPRMRIKLPGCSDWVEASGEVTWTSESGKEAGVRFAEISDDARFQIRQWVSVGGPPGELREGRAEPGREVLPGSVSDTARGRTPRPLTPEFVPRRAAQDAVNRGAQQRHESRAPDPGPTRTAASESFPRELVNRQQPRSSPSAGVQYGREVSHPSYPNAPKKMTPEPAGSEVGGREQNQDPADHIINSVRVARMLGGENDYGSFGSLVEKPDQQGWLLAVVFTVLAVIALAAGIAVGRGDLSGMLDKLGPLRNVPATQNPEAARNPDEVASASSAEQDGATPSSNSSDADVSQIEVVDASNRRWLVPLKGAVGTDAASGNAPSADAATPTEPTSDAASAPNENAPSEKAEKTPERATEGSPPVLREAPKQTRGEARIEIRTWILSPSIPIEKVGGPIYRVDPVYPPEAVRQRVEGAVKLRAIIGRDGTVQSLGLIDGPPLLVPSAMDAVRSWRNRPTLVNGRAVEVDEQIQIEFRLPE
jgi:TonB family protein